MSTLPLDYDWPAEPFIQSNAVYRSHALNLLKSLPDQSVNIIITDPPYGLGGRVFDFPHKQYTAVNEEWDHEAPIDWMAECKRVLKPGGSVVCFCGRKSTFIFGAEALRLGWRIVNDITWYKPDAPPNFTGRMMTESTERALWFCPDGSNWTYNLDVAKRLNGGINFRDVWEFGVTRSERFHPTQKPLALMQRCIELFTRPGDIVVDPFCGSGTTLVAANGLGRRYIGGDLSLEYAGIACKRLRDSDPYQPKEVLQGVTQLSLFEAIV